MSIDGGVILDITVEDARKLKRLGYHFYQQSGTHRFPNLHDVDKNGSPLYPDSYNPVRFRGPEADLDNQGGRGRCITAVHEPVCTGHREGHQPLHSPVLLSAVGPSHLQVQLQRGRHRPRGQRRRRPDRHRRRTNCHPLQPRRQRTPGGLMRRGQGQKDADRASHQCQWRECTQARHQRDLHPLRPQRGPGRPHRLDGTQLRRRSLAANGPVEWLSATFDPQVVSIMLDAKRERDAAWTERYHADRELSRKEPVESVDEYGDETTEYRTSTSLRNGKPSRPSTWNAPACASAPPLNRPSRGWNPWKATKPAQRPRSGRSSPCRERPARKADSTSKTTNPYRPTRWQHSRITSTWLSHGRHTRPDHSPPAHPGPGRAGTGQEPDTHLPDQRTVVAHRRREPRQSPQGEGGRRNSHPRDRCGYARFATCPSWKRNQR